MRKNAYAKILIKNLYIILCHFFFRDNIKTVNIEFKKTTDIILKSMLYPNSSKFLYKKILESFDEITYYSDVLYHLIEELR